MNNEVKRMLQNLVEEQDQDTTLTELKCYSNLQAKYKLHNNTFLN